MFEDMTPNMRLNYGNAISSKDDTPMCVRRRTILADNPKYLENHDYLDVSASVADENDMCTCQPGNCGITWDKMMSEMGPHDEWFERTERSREIDLAYFLEESGYDAERYQRAMTQRYAM